MANNYYTHTTYPTPNSPGSSAALRAELEAITVGFDLLPTLTGNGYKVAMVNSTGTALIATSALQSLAITGSTIDSTPIGATTRAAGSFTTLSANSTVTLGSLVTISGGNIDGTIIGATTPAAGTFSSLTATSVTVGGSSVVTLTAAQTLTNKTLTAPVISTIVNTGTLTLPTATDTLVGRTTTDTLGNKTISGLSNTLTNIGNASLVNSSITIGSTTISLGSSSATVAGLTLTTPVISSISNTGTLTLPTSTDTLVGRATTDTLTNKTISGASNTLSNIANASLTNSSVTIGSTSISLGATATTLAGLTSVTATTFTGDLSGNASTVTNGVYTSGSYADPTWITSLAGSKVSGNISGNAANVTGTVAVANGGTGATTAAGARVSLLPSLTGNAGKVLTVNVGETDATWTTLAGTGTVTSVALSGGTTGLTVTGSPITTSGTFTLAGTLAVANGGTGSTSSTGSGAVVLATSPALVTPDLGTPSAATLTNATGLPLGTGVTGTLPIANGGTGQTVAISAFNALSPITSTGDLIIGNGANSATRLGIGTNGQVLTSNGTTASWQTAAAGVSLSGNNTWTGTQTFTNSLVRLLGSSTGYTTFTSANSSVTNYTLTLPAVTDTVAVLGTAQSFTATQTFPASGVRLLGSSTGYTTFASANASVTNYTLTFPARTDTVVTVDDAVTLTNKTISGSANTITNVSLTTGVTGTLPATNGGTGQASYAVGDLLFASTTTALSKLADVATGNALISGGVGVAPSYGKIGLTTHISGTLAVGNGGTGITTGTSGGIPYFSAASTIASSAALAANALVVGGGAGVAPSTITTGTGVVTALGVAVGSAGAFVTNGGALGTPSSGTVTNLTGTASININGTVGATTPNTGAFTSITSTSAAGVLTRAAATQDGVELIGRAGGTTSLKVTLTPTTLTASRTLTLPDNSGTVLTTGATVTVAQGGTGATTLTGILKGNGTSAFTAATANTDYVTSTGADGLFTRWMFQDTGWDFFDSGTTNALDYVNGSVQRWAPNTGAQTLSITNWPPSGAMGELLIQGVNLGAATITWPTINWIKSDGTTTTTFSSNGVTLQASGTDWVLIWTRDAGTTLYGKVVR